MLAGNPMKKCPKCNKPMNSKGVESVQCDDGVELICWEERLWVCSDKGCMGYALEITDGPWKEGLI